METTVKQEDLSSLSADEVADKVLSLTHVHLEEEGIDEIDNLEMLGVGVTNLYLHRNLITKIENLESMRNLVLLSLASNKITVVENLESLSCLKALDLGYNLIECIRPGDIPPSVLYLTTDGNPLSHMVKLPYPSTRFDVTAYLECLMSAPTYLTCSSY